MSRRATPIAFAITSVLALGGLLIAAAVDRRDTAFSLGVANNRPVVSLVSGQTLCQGPLIVRAAFAAMQVWARPVRRLDVEIRSALGWRLLYARRIRARPSLTGELTVPLRTSAARRGARISVCIRNAGARRVAFEGGPPTRTSGRFETRGHRSEMAIALLFLRSHSPTLLSLLPTVFERASLFKASWARAWVFWVLGAALLGAFALAGTAVVVAAKADPGEKPDPLAARSSQG